MISNYFFLVVAIGTTALGLATSVVRTTLVLEKQSQLGDTIGHSVFPGIILSFMIFQTRQPVVLLLGAIVAGLLAFRLLHLIHRATQFPFESILALVLSSMFGLGMVLSSYIQGNPQFQNTAQAGLNRYIMGQAAYLTYDDVYLILVVVAIVCFIFIKLYPKIELVLFDKVFAQSIGIHTTRISNIVLGLCLLTICIGIKTVGVILISSMLVTPAIAALQWTKHYRSTVILSAIIGMSCTLAGTYISTVVSDFATGPVIVLCQTSCALFSIICSPNGVVRRSLKRKGGEHV